MCRLRRLDSWIGRWCILSMWLALSGTATTAVADATCESDVMVYHDYRDHQVRVFVQKDVALGNFCCMYWII